jgi:[glutamine synthetase] adenylyltransferase / [glutamine synthetase]-adenylyl-L-tyrosine phosphorylase
MVAGPMEELSAEIARGAADPADASLRLERVVAAAAAAGVALGPLDEAGRAVLRLACQRAPYLATLLCRDPERLERVARDRYLLRQKPRAVMAAELAGWLAGVAADDDVALGQALRRYRADELVRLGARELELGSPVEVGAELSHLADVCLDAAIGFHRAALERRHGPARYLADDGVVRDAELVVIGMGKLGGEELNFASDVDLIYVYSSDAGEVGPLSLHEFFARLCERVTAALAEVTDEDTVFRVDLRLRPEGSKGAIANSLPSLERYYESWGRPWERQAWIKARPCAGSMALGAEVMRTLEPFVWPRHTSPSVIADVADLNRRIKSELDRGGIERGFDLKNGVGGIREVEFFAQALQLVHGGRRPALRARATVAALDQLLFAGLISDDEAQRLGGAYRFLRRLEHLLQLDSGRQTQRLPTDPATLERFARRAGQPDAAALMAGLAEHSERVAQLFATLGDEDAGPPPEVHALLAGDHDVAGELAALAALGFRDPPQARHHLERARRRAAAPLGRSAADAAARVGPLLLGEIAASPDPDQALRYAADLCLRYGAWSSLWRMMDDSRAMLRLVASLFGTSAYLSRQFVEHPELFDALLAADRWRPRHAAGELAELLAARLPEAAGDDEAWWNALAEWKNAQTLRIGVADVAGELDAEEVSAELSGVAEACLAAGFSRIRAGLEDRHGVPRDEHGAPVAMAVLALGKLGGRELGYASDLDLVFVYRADGESDGPRPLPVVTYMTRLAQRLMGALHAMHPGGRLYEIDTRLRPSGSQGLLVSSLAAWQRYHREGVQPWERQALTKLRPVAGDPEVGAAAEALAHVCVYGAAPDRAAVAALAAAVTAMRDRIERELSGAHGRDLKTGRGGLIDVEFASQFLQLAHGHAEPALRTTSTLAALRAAAVALPELAGPLGLLVDGYRFLRTLEHRMRIVHDRSVHRLPDDPDELDKLARRVGLEHGAALAASYDRWAREVRSAYTAVVALHG